MSDLHYCRFYCRFARGLKLRQLDMIDDEIAKSSTTLTRMASTLRQASSNVTDNTASRANGLLERLEKGNTILCLLLGQELLMSHNTFFDRRIVRPYCPYFDTNPVRFGGGGEQCARIFGGGIYAKSTSKFWGGADMHDFNFMESRAKI